MPISSSPMGVLALQGLRREKRNLIAGISRVKGGEPFRLGSHVAGLPINTFFSRFYCENKNHEYRNTALTWEEETQIVKILLQGEHEGGFITPDAIKDATYAFVQNLPLYRRKSIPFKDRRPSRAFCFLFEKRHCYGIICRKLKEQDGLQAPLLVSARDVVTYFHDIEKMINNDHFYPNNIWCLTARSVQVDIGEEESFIKFLTLFAMTNASGNLLSFTHLVHNCDLEEAVEESEEFESWLTHVVDRIEALGTQNQNPHRTYELLLCDESYSFVNENVREWLFKRDVIVYSIPGLSNGSSSSHDVGCLSIWAEKFKEFSELDLEMKSPPKRTWTEITLLMFVHLARYASLTARNITDSFANAGVFPLDEVRFFKHPRAMSLFAEGKICDIQSMCDMLDAKRNSSSHQACLLQENDI